MDHPRGIKTEGDQVAHRAMKGWVIILILAALALLLIVFVLVGQS
ncbi:hypothetical protein [Aureimonas ureilytica]|nr:hypothetical protein [Aureimonas ureilytica]